MVDAIRRKNPAISGRVGKSNTDGESGWFRKRVRACLPPAMLPKILTRHFADVGLESGDVPLGQIADRVRMGCPPPDGHTFDDHAIPGGIARLPDRHAQEDRSTGAEGE